MTRERRCQATAERVGMFLAYGPIEHLTEQPGLRIHTEHLQGVSVTLYDVMVTLQRPKPRLDDVVPDRDERGPFRIVARHFQRLEDLEERCRFEGHPRRHHRDRQRLRDRELGEKLRSLQA